MNAVDPLAAAGLRPHVEVTTKMRESADITKIAPALVRAQAAMENPPRNRAVQVRTQAGAYTFRYSTLDKIGEMIRPALAENGLCILQPIVTTDRGAILLTRLLHESGQWMECEVALPPIGNNPQSFGSAVTYLKRYSLVAFLNITSDEDNDGNTAAGNHVADAARSRRQDRGNGRAETPAGPVPASPPDPDSTEAGDPANAAVWSPWVIVSRDGTIEDFETPERWVGGWKFRLAAVGKANKPPPDKRATLAAMGKANADVFASLAEAGHDAQVQEATKACKALDDKLAEQERATTGASA